LSIDGKKVVNKLKIIPVQVVVGKYSECRAKVCVGKSSDLSERRMALPDQLPERWEVEISNNRAERSIKPFVIDRKNFLVANTPRGAAGSAVIFSLMRTSVEYGLDPYKYLSHILRVAAQADLSKSEDIAALLPENAPLECRISAPK